MNEKKLLKWAEENLEGCKDFLITFAKEEETSPLEEVLKIPFNKLPLHINEKDDFKRELVLARLRKEDILNDPKVILHILYNTEFSLEEYRAVGTNDGMLYVLEHIFKELGNKKRAKECWAWTYD